MITIDNITKSYRSDRRSVQALDGISFTVQDGEVFGLLGPNGAGKTTLIKILTLLTHADSGRAEIDTFDIARDRDAIKRIIGVVPQETNLERELSGYQNLLVQAMLYRLERKQERIETILRDVELWEKKDQEVQAYSGGMKRRLLLARALLTDPAILFMDEPSIGLDPQIRHQMWDVIRKTARHGRKVLITTHYIEEAEALCDRVGILSKGRLIALDTPSRLKENFGRFVVEHVEASGELRQEICPDREAARTVANRLTSGGSESVTIRAINLEDVFLQLTGRRIE